MNLQTNFAAATSQQQLLTGTIEHKQGRLHYSLNMARALKDDWEQDLKPRVDRHLDTIKTGGDRVTQLLLASRHSDENRMTPSLVILCLSKRHRKAILNSFKSHEWRQRLRDKGVKLRVIIDKNFGEMANRGQAAWALPHLSGLSPNEVSVAIALLSSKKSFCGARIILSNRVEQGNDPLADSRQGDKKVANHGALATLGGIIAIDGRLYGLTVAHAFGAPPPSDITAEISLRSRGTPRLSVDTISSYSTSFSSGFEETLADSIDDHFIAQSHDYIHTCLTTDEGTSMACSYDSFHPAGTIVALGLAGYHDLHPSVQQNPTKHSRPAQSSDWALVRLETRLNLSNSFLKPGCDELNEIVGVKSETMLQLGEVWVIACRTGVQPGALSDVSASVTLHESHFTVHQVRLQRCLG